LKHLIKILLILSLFQLANPVFAADSNDNVLVQMFVWWNGAIKDPNGFTEEAFRRYYTEDAAIIINSTERVRGIKNLVTHFKNIQQKVESVEIVLPFEEGFESGNRIFTYHTIRSRRDGVDGVSHIMGYAIVEDGKIALADFISYQPPGSETSPAH
jgi:ketosteroid isomerase-like protein